MKQNYVYCREQVYLNQTSVFSHQLTQNKTNGNTYILCFVQV